MSVYIEDDALDTQDFWSILKNVKAVPAKVGGNVLAGGAAFLGPVGAPLTAITGVAFGLAVKLPSDAESTLEPAPDYKAQASRAILSEAALQTVLEMDGDQWKKYGLSQKMLDAYRKNKKAHVALVSRTLTPMLTSSAMELSIIQSEGPDITATSSYPEIVPLSEEMESATDSREGAFVAGLQEAARDQNHEEGFIEFLGQVANVGIQTTPVVIDSIPENIIKEEAPSNTEPKKDEADGQWDALLKRSLMGEAALQAIMTIPSEEMRAGGIFNELIGTVHSIGSTVIRAAPTVSETVTPLSRSAVTGESRASE